MQNSEFFSIRIDQAVASIHMMIGDVSLSWMCTALPCLHYKGWQMPKYKLILRSTGPNIIRNCTACLFKQSGKPPWDFFHHLLLLLSRSPSARVAQGWIFRWAWHWFPTRLADGPRGARTSQLQPKLRRRSWRSPKRRPCKSAGSAWLG